MNVGVVADTHDDLAAARAAADFFEDRVETVLHCGDVVAPFTAAPFDRGFEFHAVWGNNDGEPGLAGAVDAFGTHHGEFAALALDGVDVGVYHGTSGELVDALVASGDYDLVCHGHTHERVHEVRDGVVRLNPGGLPIPGADDAFHVAVVDTADLSVEHVEL